MTVENISVNKSFGGWHKQYSHHSKTLNCAMRFAIYLPPQASNGKKVPVLYWLSGLTCTDENFMQKAGLWMKTRPHTQINAQLSSQVLNSSFSSSAQSSASSEMHSATFFSIEHDNQLPAHFHKLKQSKQFECLS